MADFDPAVSTTYFTVFVVVKNAVGIDAVVSADRQTDRHTDTIIAILRTALCGERKIKYACLLSV